jgi:hypothetical protein
LEFLKTHSIKKEGVRKMKRSKGITLGIMIIALVVLPFFSAYCAEKQLPAGAPSKIIQPPQATKPIKLLPDLIVERVWLDDEGLINFQLKNAGQGGIPDKEYRQGMVRVTYGSKYEDFSFTRAIKTKPPMDPKGLLKKPNGVVQYNTGIKVAERLTVKVVVDSLAKVAEANDQNNQGTLPAPAMAALKAKGKEVQPVSPEVGREIAQKEKLKTLEGGGTPPLSANLRVLAPNNGEQWYRGGYYRIRWEGIGTGSHVTIVLLKEGGRTTKLQIATSVENTGQYDWQIPGDLELRDDYKIRVLGVEGPSGGVQRVVGSDDSDANFSIVNAETREIRVIDPNGGEKLYYTVDSVRQGRRFKILWWSRGVGNQVKIELYNAAPHMAGTLCRIIAESVDNDENAPLCHGRCTGYYEWWPPADTVPSQYKIRVSGLGRLSTVYDESDALFHIREAPPPVTEEVVLPMEDWESETVECYSRSSGKRCYTFFSAVMVGVGTEGDFSCRRGIASFDISGIPPHATNRTTIDSAILDLSRYHVEGSWPNNLGCFMIYQIPPEIPHFDLRTNFTIPGTLCGGTSGPPSSPFDVTFIVAPAHRAGWIHWTIRLEFEIQDPDENSRNPNYVIFHGGMDGCTLKIRYTYIPYEESSPPQLEQAPGATTEDLVR